MEKRCDPWEVYPTYLANDTQDIHYSSGWTILTHQGSFDKGGVEAYNHDACAWVIRHYWEQRSLSCPMCLWLMREKHSLRHQIILYQDTYIWLSKHICRKETRVSAGCISAYHVSLPSAPWIPLTYMYLQSRLFRCLYWRYMGWHRRCLWRRLSITMPECLGVRLRPVRIRLWSDFDGQE